MNSIEELIHYYEKELESLNNELQFNIDRKCITCIEFNKGERIRVREFLEQLKNLPNELRAVNRNEQAKEICPDCGEIMERRYYCPKRGCLYYIP